LDPGAYSRLAKRAESLPYGGFGLGEVYDDKTLSLTAKRSTRLPPIVAIPDSSEDDGVKDDCPEKEGSVVSGKTVIRADSQPVDIGEMICWG
jgi:hypothetical protein